jgi:SAM-dependent methyltransferase
VAVASNFNARNAAVYAQSMGRWSRLAKRFAAFARLAPGERVLDEGCGTGSLLFQMAVVSERPVVTGIDVSPLYVDAARARIGDTAVNVAEGDACALDFPDGAFDRVLSQLVLQFIPARAAGEMRRATRQGGTVTAAMLATRAHLHPAADPPRRTRRIVAPAGPGGGAGGRRHYLNELRRLRGLLGADRGRRGHAGVLRDRDAQGAAERAGEPSGRRLRPWEADGLRSFAATAFVCRGVKR